MLTFISRQYSHGTDGTEVVGEGRQRGVAPQVRRQSEHPGVFGKETTKGQVTMTLED